jgi:hypothetical protein
MSSVLIGVLGTLLGVLLGGTMQQATKRDGFAEYLRSISASYAQAMSGLRTRSEDANLYAATAQIEILCDDTVAGPARRLTDAVIDVHSRIAAGMGVAQETVEDVDRRRYELINLFKADVEHPPVRRPSHP